MNKNNVMHGELPDYTVQERKSHLILKLRNFRSYGDGEIKIPVNSVTLINGPSGVGKTTIFEAFIFIMYNGVQNPERFETKTCWAVLYIGDLIIYRQKSPILLKVWKSKITSDTTRTMEEFTNDDGQRIIDSIYGNLDTFIGCSYLRQKEFSVFLTGRDAEKLEIIRNVATRGAELDEIKIPIKNELDRLKTQYTSVTAQLEMAISNVKNFDLKNPNITSYQVPENSADVVKEVKDVRSRIELLDKEYEQCLNKEININTIQHQINQIVSKLEGLNNQLKSIEVQSIQNKIEELDNKLKEFNNTSFDAEKLAKAQMFKIWNEDKRRQEAKLLEINKELDIISGNIIKEISTFPPYPKFILAEPEKEQKFPLNVDPDYISKCTEAQKKINLDTENIRTIQNEISTLLNQIQVKSLDEAKKLLESLNLELDSNKSKEESMKKNLDANRLANKMKCPGCSIVLVMGPDGKSLNKCENSHIGIGAMLHVEKKEETSNIVTHDDVSKMAILISKLTNDRNNTMAILSACTEKEEKLKVMSSSNINYNNLLLIMSKYMETLKFLNTSLEGLNSHITRKPEEITTEKSVDLTEKNKLEMEKNQLIQQINNRELIIKIVESEENNKKAFNQMLENLTDKNIRSSNAVKLEKADLQGKVDRLMHISSASDLLTQRHILEKTMREKSDLATETEKLYQASGRLMTKAIEAERIALQTAMDEINTNLNSIIKRLFTRTPMTVEISTTKKLKSKKDAVSQRFDIQIFYNNSEYGNAGQLSGGEKDRLSLAITLAVSQKFGSPILFLDETLSSLDAELKSEAVSLLKEYSEYRTIVCVSHEETEGLYNHVIRCSKSKN